MELTPSIVLPTRNRNPYDVTRLEVDLAVQFVVKAYKPLEPHGQALYDFSVASQDAAHAIVKIAWTFAKLERAWGEARRFNRFWSDMEAAKVSDDYLPKNLPVGERTQMSRGEKDIIVVTVRQIFNVPETASEKLVNGIGGAIIGKEGSAIATSLKILELLVGKEGYKQMEVALEKARSAEAAAIAAGTAAPETSESDEDEAAEEEIEQAEQAAS